MPSVTAEEVTNVINTSFSQALSTHDVKGAVEYFDKHLLLKIAGDLASSATTVAKLLLQIVQLASENLVQNSAEPEKIKTISEWQTQITESVRLNLKAKNKTTTNPTPGGATSSGSNKEVNEAHFFPSQNSLKAFLHYLGSATKTLDICVFTITDDRIANTIIKSFQNGVKVRVITDNDKSLDLGADIGRMRKAGIPIVMDKTSAHMHNKFCVIDRSLLINGSFNWTVSASNVNNENIIVSSNPSLVNQFSKEFERLWQQFNE